MRASLLRKRGLSVESPRLRILRHRHSQARRRMDKQRFSPQLTQRVLQKTRLRRSELAYYILKLAKLYAGGHALYYGVFAVFFGLVVHFEVHAEEAAEGLPESGAE